MNLFEIDQAILELCDPETGELQDYEAFAALQMERTAKVEGVALWIKDLTAEAKAIKEEVDTLNDRRRAAEAKADRLKGYLDMALDGEKFTTPRCAVSFRRTSSLQVADPLGLIRWAEESGHDDCVRYKDPEISKSEITRLIKAGVEVPGAALVAGRSVGVK